MSPTWPGTPSRHHLRFSTPPVTTDSNSTLSDSRKGIMLHFLKSILASAKTPSARSCLSVEVLEDRLVPAISIASFQAVAISQVVFYDPVAVWIDQNVHDAAIHSQLRTL